MNGTQTQVLTSHSSSTSALRWGAASSMLEAAAAIAVIALAIVGLAGVFSSTMAAIATIVVGAAVLIQGGTLTAISEHFNARRAGETITFSQPVGMDFLGGVATLVLGILALLGLDTQTLLSVAILVLGASFLFSNQGLIGLAGVVLGILAVVGLVPLTLVLVGLLCLGVGALVGGSMTATHAISAQPEHA